MLAKGKLPNFARVMREGAWGQPEALERYPHLDPWVTWVTLHTGVDRSVHGATVLEQDQATIKAKRTWDYAIEAGKSVGIFGSISASVRPVPGFVVPGPFAPNDDTFPAFLRPIQALNRSATRAHNKIEGEASLANLAKQGVELFKFGLRPQTCARAVQELARERMNKKLYWRRASLQPLVNADFFTYLYGKYQPEFATWHSNHAAHYMHHYWRAYDDSKFLTPASAEEKKHHGPAVEYGYEICDQLLGRFMSMVDSDTVVAVASSMGQKPYVKDDFPKGRFAVRFKDMSRLLDIFGAKGVAGIVHVMTPQVNVKIPDDIERRRVMELCARARREGATSQNAIAVTETGDILTLSPSGLASDDTGSVRYFFDGAPHARAEGYELDELFASDAPSPKQGMHDPRGLFFLHGAGIRQGVELRDIGPLDIAPTLLTLMGIPVPAIMKGRVLGEAWQQPPRLGIVAA
jgi:hypothetical protein